MESKKSLKHKKSFLRERAAKIYITTISEATKSRSTERSVSLSKSFYGTQHKFAEATKSRS